MLHRFARLALLIHLDTHPVIYSLQPTYQYNNHIWSCVYIYIHNRSQQLICHGFVSPKTKKLQSLNKLGKCNTSWSMWPGYVGVASTSVQKNSFGETQGFHDMFIYVICTSIDYRYYIYVYIHIYIDMHIIVYLSIYIYIYAHMILVLSIPIYRINFLTVEQFFPRPAVPPRSVLKVTEPCPMRGARSLFLVVTIQS